MAYLHIECQVTTSHERWEGTLRTLMTLPVPNDELVNYLAEKLHVSREVWRTVNPRWVATYEPSWFWQSPLTIDRLTPDDCEAIKGAW